MSYVPPPVAAPVLPYASSRSRNYVSGHSRAKTAIGLLAFTSFMAVLLAVSTLMQIALIKRFQAGQTPTASEISANDLRQGAVAVVYLVAFILTVVFFSMWMHRVYKNLFAFPGRNPKTTPGRAVGSFFIPIINFYRPYQAMKEIYTSSDSRYGGDSAIVGVWWTCWILTGVVERIGNAVARGSSGDEAARLLVDSQFTIVTSVMVVVSGVVAMIMIRRIDEMQDAAAMQSEPPPKIAAVTL